MQERIKTHCVHTPLASLEEAANHRLMALICEDTEAHEHLVLSIMAMIANAQENEVAAIDVSIGNIYLSLSHFSEIFFSYKRNLLFQIV